MLNTINTTRLELPGDIDAKTIEMLREIANKLGGTLSLPDTVIEKETKRKEEEETNIVAEIDKYINYIVANGNSTFYVAQIIRLSKKLNGKNTIISLQQKHKGFEELGLDSTNIEINNHTIGIIIKHLEQQTIKDYEISLGRNNITKENRTIIENNRDSSLRKIEEFKRLIQ